MARPFLKVAGGKRNHPIIDRIPDLLPDNFSTYIEPFLGGGAVYFALQERGLLEDKRVILGDADADLIQLYEAVREDAESVLEDADLERDLVVTRKTEEKMKEAYRWLRDEWSCGGQRTPAVRLYLQHAVLNGIFRVSKRGNLNSPPRGLDKVSLPTQDNIIESSYALAGVEFRPWSFRQYSNGTTPVGPGVVWYIDPPYDGPPSRFVQYTPDGFSDDDQASVIAMISLWSSKGATVFYSNADTPFIRECLTKLWPAATVEKVDGMQFCSCDGQTRGPRTEVFAYA